MLLSTLTNINLDGANIKETKRFNDKLIVAKERIQENCYDNVCEVITYKLACILGVPCCEAGLLKDNRAYSVVDENLFRNIEHACEFVGLDDGLISEVWAKFIKLGVDNKFLESILQMHLFDILTRQLDRNLTNFSIIKNKPVKLYPLYDNGLCLFSTTKFKSSLEFVNRSGENSSDVIDFCKSKMMELNVSNVFKQKLMYKDVLQIIEHYKELMHNKPEELADWVIRQQENIFYKSSSKMFGSSNSFAKHLGK